MKNSLFTSLLAIAVLAVSCKKEEIPSTPEILEWKEAPGFTLSQKRAYNSAVWNNQLFILTEKSVAETDANGGAFHRFHFGRLDDFKMPFSENYFMTIEPNAGLLFFASKNPQTGGSNFFLTFQNIRNDITGLHPLSYAGTFAINNQDKMLLPLVKNDGKGVLALLDVQMKNNGLYWEVDTVASQLIELSNFSWIGAINSIEDNFFVSFYSDTQSTGGTARISPDGAVTMILGPDNYLHRFMRIGNQWLALSKNDILFRSTNDGLNWESLGSPQDNGLKNFSSLTIGHSLIDGQTVFYTQDAIFLAGINSDGSFMQKTVNIKGLEGNSITSVIGWNDQVFVTTLSGVFTMKKEDFFENN